MDGPLTLASPKIPANKLPKAKIEKSPLSAAPPDTPLSEPPAESEVPAAPELRAGGVEGATTAYPPPASEPTQVGPEGIRYDFNLGARVALPAREAGLWRVRLRDLDTGNILFESDNKGALVNSSKRWFVRFKLEIWSVDDDPKIPPRLVLDHEYDTSGQEVLIQFPIGTLGDILAWFPYAARFAECHPHCRVICALSGLIIPLLRDAYPNLCLVTHEEMVAQRIADSAYATYSLGLFFDDVSCDWQPTDFRFVGLHRTAGYILGVDPTEAPVRLLLPDDSRPIEEPYAVIAVQSSSGCKYWTNPTGWRDVVAFLKARGYRVVCIDQKPVHGHGLMWTYIPNGAEDLTGDFPLTERARYLKHAALFVGLSSGLAWLAWAAGCPVVLISGFTHPTNEFTTPYRVINWHACNSCWNDPKERFDHKDFLWCPRHQNTPRQFECTRLITSAHVTRVMEGIPGLAPVRDAVAANPPS
jgi:autotransporter strand-loop-strand O-heptosyltransferase